MTTIRERLLEARELADTSGVRDVSEAITAVLEDLNACERERVVWGEPGVREFSVLGRRLVPDPE